MSSARLGTLALCLVWAVMGAGCVSSSGPYQLGQGWRTNPEGTEASPAAGASPEISAGEPNKVIDCTGWVLGIPEKVMLFDSRVSNHLVSAQTSAAVSDYLVQNRLADVCVRVNEYAPGEEWRRLCANGHVGAGWRYTVGAMGLVGYTLLPGRLFGGDRYNPYTNSVYVYSDVPSLAIKAAAYAKDVHSREHPGTYAFANQLPVVSLWHETVSTKDALGYIQAVSDPDQQAEAQRILYPSHFLSIGGAIPGIAGTGPIVIASSAVIGHVTGRLQKQTAPTGVEGEAPPAPATVQASMSASESPPVDQKTPTADLQQTGGSVPPR